MNVYCVLFFDFSAFSLFDEERNPFNFMLVLNEIELHDWNEQKHYKSRYAII